MRSHEPGTVVLGATPILDRFGQHCRERNPKSKKMYPAWSLPKPICQVPHWINPKLRAKAEAKGLDRMTAGVKYTVMVPVYRGMSAQVFATLKNQARRKAMSRWSS